MWTHRNGLRYAAVVLAGIVAGSHGTGAYQSWVQWRLWRERDPSGAEASLTAAQLDLVVVGIAAAAGAGGDDHRARHGRGRVARASRVACPADAVPPERM